MKSKLKLLIVFLTIVISFSFIMKSLIYDSKYVQVSTVKHKGNSYKLIYMERGLSSNRIKAKYFAANDPFNGTPVPDRYISWASNKSIICVTSGTYMDGNYVPVGLTIDNGIVVNRTLDKKMDGLVIVYATGGVVATNLDDKDLKVQGGKISDISLDLRGNSYHKTEFLKWSKEREATVFQTHLLVYKNQLKISSYNSSPDKRERRFLAVGKDEDGNVVHCIVHSPEYTTLYEGSKRVLDFLNSFKDVEVIFMINLDTGAQDVFTLFDEKGIRSKKITGRMTINDAVNLLVYYYE